MHSSHVEVSLDLQSLLEKPKLHPEQQKVIDLLEQYPATEFHFSVWHTHDFLFPDAPVILTKPNGLAVCFTCVAGWTTPVHTPEDASREARRLVDVARLTSDRAASRMSELVHGQIGTMPKADCIALVRNIFTDQ